MNYYFKKELKKELPKWRESGIITDETAQKIASMYDLDDKSVISFVGYLFLGLSLLIFVGANWQEIPRFERFIIVLFLSGMTHFAAIYTRKNDEKLSDYLFFLGNICFAASIALISQMYHFGRYIGDGILLFCVAITPLVLTTKSAILCGQLLIGGTIWFVFERFGGAQCYSYALILGICALILYWRDSGWLLFFTLMGAIIYVLGFINFYDLWQLLLANAIVVFGSILFAIYGLSMVLGGHLAQYAPSMRTFSLTLGWIFALFLYLFIYRGDVTVVTFKASYNFYNILAALTPLFILAIARSNYYFATSLAAFCLFCFIEIDDYLIMKILASFVVFAIGLRLIIKGEINNGLSAFFLLALSIYFNLTFDYIGSSALFLVFGLVLILINKRNKNLDKKRELR
ncbi:MAG: DUF2157 domain-containing protein [Campylobacter sp.]